MKLLTVKKRMTIALLIQKIWMRNQNHIQMMKYLKKIKRPFKIGQYFTELIYKYFIHTHIINIGLHFHVDGFATVYLTTYGS